MNSGIDVKIPAVFVLVLALVLSGCSRPKDRFPDLGYAELNKVLSGEAKDADNARKADSDLEKRTMSRALPKLSAPTYNPLNEVRISLHVQDESLHSILYVIARNAGLNLVIEPGISLENRVTISFEKTLSSVAVEKLLKAYDLAWSVEGNVLNVSLFEERNFDLGFLNSKNEVLMTTGGDIFGSSLGEGGSTLRGDFQIRSAYGAAAEKGTLYAQIKDSVQDIIRDGAGANDKPQPSGQFQGGGAGMVAMDTLSGTLYVKTTPSRMRAVSQMVGRLKTKLNGQVIIDARILEVVLKDEFRLGIDWEFLRRNLTSGHSFDYQVGLKSGKEGLTPVPLTIDPNLIPRTMTALTGTIEALSTFGNVKLLSNPHVRAGHAQAAMFTSGLSENYLRNIKREYRGDVNNISTLSTEVASAFSGVMLGVVPFMTGDDDVELKIFPIKSEVDKNSLVPERIGSGDDKISLPKIEVKNVSTTVRVRDGDTVILGGLIDKRREKSDSGIPFLSSIPILGKLFGYENYYDEVREMVIIMQIRILR